jgi:NAD(P)-dependent dehydrogenase (short-subunit alcohol dehydrogenase family)
VSSGFSLEGRVAIVTGASRGIGEAIARLFVEHGAQVVVASRKQEGVDAVASSLGPRAIGIAAHTGRQEECLGLVEKTISTFGKVDILVNNAGTNLLFGPMLDSDEAAWAKIFEVNVQGYFWLARAVARHLIERGAPGSIINVSSVAGVEAAIFQGVYGMSKAAVISMTRTLAVELAGASIRVNAIAPGLIQTRLASGIINNEPMLEQVMAKTPLGRIGRPEEIAGAALFLAGDASSYMTGQTLVIDGGMTIS